MRRLLSAMARDAKVQYRNGFYAAAALLAVALIALLRWLPEGSPRWLMPALILGNLQANAFYFMAGLVLLEKAEGSIEALVVTPLRRTEYLASKVLTLAALSFAEALVIVAASIGSRFDPWPLAAGVVLAGAIFSLYGFAVVARYDSINEFLIPSVLYTAVLMVPLLDYFELWEGWPAYLHPVQAPLVLMEAAFRPVASWEVVYGFVYACVWIVPMAAWCGRVFGRFVVASAGVR